MDMKEIFYHIGLLEMMQETGKVNVKPSIDILRSCVDYYDSQKYIRQVGELILLDDDGLCEVTSDITCGGNKDNCFEITNPRTGRKVQISVKMEEI